MSNIERLLQIMLQLKYALKTETSRNGKNKEKIEKTVRLYMKEMWN